MVAVCDIRQIMGEWTILGIQSDYGSCIVNLAGDIPLLFADNKSDLKGEFEVEYGRHTGVVSKIVDRTERGIINNPAKLFNPKIV
jgi:hypothetical protein